MPVERWPQVLTKLLPPDLSVLKAEDAAPDFHARFSADRRWYRYRIQVEGRDPHRSRYAHYWTGLELDAELMQSSAQMLVGNHDFYAFSQEVPPEANTKREIHSIRVSRVKDELRIDVVGNAFLRGMMRRISGSLLEIGRGARDPQTLSHLLDQRRREPMLWPVVLPAHGLCLMKVTYGRHPRDNRTKNRLNLREDDDE
jgi:tRNA pseudouridine38-40 synthase